MTTYVDTGHGVITKNEYMKDYYKTHPEYRQRKLEYDRAYYRTHPEVKERLDSRRKNDPQHKRWQTEYFRKNYIGTIVDGKRVWLRASGKRPRTRGCELCSKPDCRLNYHHWDPSDLSRGLWLCVYCHAGVRAADRALLGKYLELKVLVEREFLDMSEGRDVPEQFTKGRVTTTMARGQVRVPVLFKRLKPEACELCGQFAPKAYHHWDNTNLSKGLWLCPYCHAFAELTDRGLIYKYFVLKEQMSTRKEE